MADNGDLAAQFEEERERRQRKSPSTDDEASDVKASPEPFTGIKEIVIDAGGNPVAIEKRPPPPPATVSEELSSLVSNPLFAFGALATIGSIVLLFAISAADSAADYALIDTYQ